MILSIKLYQISNNAYCIYIKYTWHLYLQDAHTDKIDVCHILFMHTLIYCQGYLFCLSICVSVRNCVSVPLNMSVCVAWVCQGYKNVIVQR